MIPNLYIHGSLQNHSKNNSTASLCVKRDILIDTLLLVVNKNAHTSFCALGADHALEQINRSVKITDCSIGITLQPSARTKFFVIAPELARLETEALQMAGVK